MLLLAFKLLILKIGDFIILYDYEIMLLFVFHQLILETLKPIHIFK